MEYGFYSDLCKLGHGPIDDEEWYHVPRLVSSLTKWSVDPRLLVWSRATHLRFPRAFRDTVGALILAVNCTASAVASVDENPGRIIFETQPPGLWGEGFAEVATSEPAILAGQHRWHSHTQVSQKLSSRTQQTTRLLIQRDIQAYIHCIIVCSSVLDCVPYNRRGGFLSEKRRSDIPFFCDTITPLPPYNPCYSAGLASI